MRKSVTCLLVVLFLFVLIGCESKQASNDKIKISSVTFGSGRKDSELTGVGTSFNKGDVYIALETSGEFKSSSIKLLVAKVSSSGSSSGTRSEVLTVNPQSNFISFKYPFSEASKYKVTFLNEKTDEVMGEGVVTIN